MLTVVVLNALKHADVDAADVRKLRWSILITGLNFLSITSNKSKYLC